MDSQTSLKSVRRALELLSFLASSNAPKSFTDAYKALGVSKATTSRLLSTLEDTGMVLRNSETGKYILGLTALRLGSVAGNQIELRRDLRPFLTELMERTGETSNLMIMEDTHPVFVDNVESVQTLRMYSRIGRAASPYRTAGGKALLAFQLSETLQKVFEREPFERLTTNSICTQDAFLSELEHVREQGYAVDDEEGEIGARCIGAPILSPTGHAIAAISISGPSSRITKERFPELGCVVREVALRAQGNLGTREIGLVMK